MQFARRDGSILLQRDAEVDDGEHSDQEHFFLIDGMGFWLRRVRRIPILTLNGSVGSGLSQSQPLPRLEHQGREVVSQQSLLQSIRALTEAAAAGRQDAT